MSKGVGSAPYSSRYDYIEKLIINSQKISIELDEQCISASELLYKIQCLSLYLLNECDDMMKQMHNTIIYQCVERSIEMIIGMFTIFTCGLVYSALNPQDTD
ncbi:unnamed protein product, partial [Didymodactylos carnosus]